MFTFVDSDLYSRTRAPPMIFFFFFNDTATTEIYTLSLHDALPIYACPGRDRGIRDGPGGRGAVHRTLDHGPDHHRGARRQGRRRAGGRREERRIRDPQARDGGRPLPAVLVRGPRAPGAAHPRGPALRAGPPT